MPCGSKRRYYPREQDSFQRPNCSNQSDLLVNNGNSQQSSLEITEGPEYSEKYLRSQKNYCFSCGTKINPTDVFCSNCGVKIT